MDNPSTSPSQILNGDGARASSPLNDGAAEPLDATESTPPRYILEKHLGSGTSGMVYCAWDSVLGQKVALKMLALSTYADRGLLLREVKLARRLRHPGIVGIHDLVYYNDNPCISMEYVDGVTLKDVLSIDKRISSDKVITWALQICSALACAHKEKVVHCDLKPENILVDDSDRIRLTDFGLAIHLHSYDIDRRCGGTPPYMSPEQKQGLPVDARTDIYSMGLILFEAFLGERATAAELEQGARPALRKRLKNAPVLLRHVITRCLEYSANERYQSVEEAMHDLANCGSNRPMKVIKRVPTRIRLVFSILLVAVIVVFGVADFGYSNTLLPHRTILLRRFLYVKTAEPEAHLLYDTLWDQLSNPNTSSLWMTPPGPGFTGTISDGITSAEEELELRVESSTMATVTLSSSRWPHRRRRYVFRAATFNQLELEVLKWLQHESINVDLRPWQEHASIFGAPWRSLLVANQDIGWSRPTEKSLNEALSELSSIPANRRSSVTCLLRKAQAEALLARITNRPFYADAARKDLTAVLTMNTWNGAISRLVQIRFLLGDREQAVYAMEHLGYDLLASEQGKMLSGRSMAESGEAHHSIPALTDALKMNPLDLNAYTFRGLGQISLGRYDDAIASFRQSLSIEPGNIRDLNNLAFAYLRAGDSEAALKPLGELLAKTPTSMGYVNLGLALFSLRRDAEGLPYCEKAAKMSPQAEIYTGYLAHAQRWRGMSEEARANYIRAISLGTAELKISERPEIYADLGVYYAALGRRTQFEQMIERARELKGTDVETDYKQCEGLVLLGDFNEAREHLRLLEQSGYSVKCLRRDPDLAKLF